MKPINFENHFKAIIAGCMLGLTLYLIVTLVFVFSYEVNLNEELAGVIALPIFTFIGYLISLVFIGEI